MTSSNTLLALFDTEPERMRHIMHTWWFAGLITGVLLFIAAVVGIMWLTTPASIEAPIETTATQRPEQKLLNRKQLQEVIDAYRARGERYDAALLAPVLLDPSK